MDLLDYMAH